jgi:hypothetical protein
MNILFLYPHPAEDRCRQYRRAALDLRDKYGHEVVFVYIGEPKIFDDDLPTEHFDSWASNNRDVIARTNLIDMGKEYPSSNLWRCIVAQRTLGDYSYIGGSYAYTKYSLEEVELFLKSVVMFHRYVLEKYQVQLAVAHAPDVVHSQVLFELSLSLPFIAINQFYDAYWGGGSRYLVDEVSFSSSLIRQRYKKNLSTYETAILPLESKLENLVSQCCNEDPRRLYRPDQWPTSLSETVKTALLSLVHRHGDFAITKPGIFEAYYRHHLPGKIMAWMLRAHNLVGRRYLVKFASDLPKRPYLFFAPNYQPESTTLASAPVWSDMLAIIRMLSASLPAGFQLVIKDHPMIGGYRPVSFYKAVLELPNTVLLQESFSTRRVIEKSAMVSTLSGTVGFQALMFGKPLLLFGRVYYDCVDGILRPPPDLNDLPILLKDVLVNGKGLNPDRSRRALMAFMEAYRSMMVHNEKMENSRTPEEQGEGLAELVDYWIRRDLETLLRNKQVKLCAEDNMTM